MNQYFEDAVDESARDLREKVLIPSKSTFNGKRYDGWDENKRERKVKNCEGNMVMTHTDADGLVSAALLMDYHGEENTNFIEVDYSEIEGAFELICEKGDDIETLYVTDLNLDEVYPVIEEVAESVEEVVWLDHHEWEEKEQEVRDMGVDITVNQERCGAGIVHQYLKDRGYEPADTVGEVVRMTEDHDLWNHEMDDMLLGGYSVCISKVFSNFAFWSDSGDFVENILDYGFDFLAHEEELLWDGKGNGFLAQRHAEHELKLTYILKNEVSIETVGDFEVAFAHGRANPGDIVDRIDGEFDFLVHTKPSYPVKASIRATDESGFTDCHRVAEMFGGGGHDQAAGCTPEVAQDPIEFMGYIHSHGEPLQEEFRNRLENAQFD